ncbi:PIG-L family deacetylase [Phototrophicus methaneseepsis]|uniref:PIG-L family deacetylase n=1 Tax=Phototrophicus methaneseepsis TaxID=2710758 RepID=A0A7S8E7N2_9CHLR|nr:PIG-L family deacetylase [Phototrophicus methaneseepsis]QPC81803.1 PIG-L family deacetylase [Phototrophicus methaneseepsis]
MTAKRLLFSLAHPDDESFGSGAVIAKYVAEGVDVSLICATDGDMGTIPDAMKGQYQTIRELRVAEMHCAAEKLGFKHLFMYGYCDSGMMNSESNQDPKCLWYNWQNEPDVVVQRVVETIRTVKPQVIVTFNKYGGYGHPDHIAIQQATEKAFFLAGDPDYAGSDLEPYQPQKLYYTAMPGLILRINLVLMRLRGQDPRKMGVNKDLDFVAVVENIEPVHAKVNITGYLQAWDEASACHASQGGGMASAFPMWLRRILYRTQDFTRTYPRPNRNSVDERDLFTGVKLEL